MQSYAQREIFTSAFENLALFYAGGWVARIPASYGNELRCHELARVVHRLLMETVPELRTPTKGYRAIVIDAKLGMQEHSWIELVRPVDLARDHPTGYHQRFILDVYCSGRLPQVQLIDPSAPGTRDYAGEYVLNPKINERIIQEVYTDIMVG